jgi:serine/threonine protein kinase
VTQHSGPGVTGPIGVVAHYNLLESLEPSGPGEMFRARDTKAGRTVTLRWLPADFTPDAAARAELIAEAKSMTSLSHPNIITLFDAGEHDGRVFLVFEFLQGQSLRKEMAGQHLNLRRAVETSVQIADAIAAAHATGLVHGGLSPESVSVTARGHAKVPAFWLAAHTGFTESNQQLRDYDSPEEMQGQLPDDRSDIYSVGAILYDMLTGRRPNPRGSAAPSTTNRHVSKELDDLTLRAVAPNPDLRPQSMAALAGELRVIVSAMDGRSVRDEIESGPEPAGTGAMMRVGLILLILAAAAWWVLR